MANFINVVGSMAKRPRGEATLLAVREQTIFDRQSSVTSDFTLLYAEQQAAARSFHPGCQGVLANFMKPAD
jgi:hypothetical protein